MENPPVVPCEKDISCLTLAQAAYYEARGEGDEGMKAVMSVILNRVDHPTKRFPASIEAVIKQGKEFSYLYDNSLSKPLDEKSWHQALYLANQSLANPNKRNTKALFYHRKGLQKTPKFAKINRPLETKGKHVFYACSVKYC